METHFTAEFFRGNRQQLATLFAKPVPMVVTANGLLQRNGDSNFSFRQDSNFWYLTGLDMPDAVLVIDKGKEYIILPELSPHEEVFGSPRDLKQIAQTSGIADILDNKAGWKQLSTRLKQVKRVGTPAAAAAYMEHYGFYTNPARASLIAKMKDINAAIKPLDVREHLAHMRSVKQPVELQAMQQAIDITKATLKDVEKRLLKYEHEYQVEADISHGFRTRGARGHAFEPIIAAGGNGAVLHYQANDQPMTNTNAIVLDVGAEYKHYAADITRTYFYKEPTKRQAAVYQAVQEVQDFAMQQMRPGVLVGDNEKQIEALMGEKLRELGLIKSTSKESIRKYYPHSASHFLGLDVHDVGDYRRPLEPGMVLTVEPGIYIPKEGIGVRIEDDVLITDTGHTVLSSLATKGKDKV